MADWSEEARIVRYLNSTIPIDLGTAVSFVPERNQRTDPESAERDANKTPEVSLTGDEASEFYKAVLSLPQQNQKGQDIRTTKRTVSGVDGCRRKKAIPSMKPNTKSSGGKTCTPFQVFQYAQNNELDLLKTSLSSGCFDVDMQDNFHWTLLMAAAFAGHTKVVKWLLDNGAKWREYTDRSMNAADLARSRGYIEVADFIENFGSKEEDGEELGRSKQNRTKKNRTFFCDSCQMAVTCSPKAGHNTSITHRYCSGQHCTSSVVSYGIPESNRGFQMLLRSGWSPENGLGPQRQGHRFPVKTVLKQDRLGFGVDSGKKARVTHFPANDKNAIRSHRERHRKEQKPFKNKKTILQDKHKEKQWERRIRTIMTHEDSHLFTS